MGGKLKALLINTILVFSALCLLMFFLLMLKQYDVNNYKAQMYENDKKASEYRVRTEAYKMELAKVKLEMETAHLQAFLKYYGGEDYAKAEKEDR